jgi:hypothetical protein
MNQKKILSTLTAENYDNEEKKTLVFVFFEQIDAAR